MNGPPVDLSFATQPLCASLEYLVRLYAVAAGFRAVPIEAPASGARRVAFRFGGTASSSEGERNESLTLNFIAANSMIGDAGNHVAFAPEAFNRALDAARSYESFRSCIAVRSGSAIDVDLDIWGFAYYLLTAQQELTDSRRDAHGRFLGSYSTLPKETFELPVVNMLFENLRRLILETLNLPWKREPERQTICLTHDVDLIRKYRGFGGLKRMIGNAVRQPKSASAELKAGCAAMLAGGRDPYDSFDGLHSIKERISAPSTWFLMAERGGPNSDYSLNETDIRSLLLRGRGIGDEFALHGSMESPDRADKIAQEKAALESAIGGTATGSRQHYLRFSMPQTWRHLSDAGFRYDSTIGFPDRAGFRLGWSGPLPVFDHEKQRELPLVEIPLVCMDVSLAVYEKIAPELALERLTNLLDASCEAHGGAFVFLWHNTIADRIRYPGYWDTFEYFFSIASGSARFVTLAQLCDEHDAQAKASQSGAL